MAEKLLTISAVARIKGVSRTTVYNAIASGRLTNLNSEGPPVLREIEVNAWVPERAGGARNVSPMSKAAKERLSESQKRRWEKRKMHDNSSSVE